MYILNLLCCSESAIMQSPITIHNIWHLCLHRNSPCYMWDSRVGWSLPGGPLQSIVALLGSFNDLLAFASTCRSWRAAFWSYPSKSRFYALLSPLLVKPPISPCVHELHRWQVIDLANPKTDLCWQIPQEICKEAMHFAGSSYGQLICGLRKDCLIVDVFTGAGQSLGTAAQT